METSASSGQGRFSLIGRADDSLFRTNLFRATPRAQERGGTGNAIAPGRRSTLGTKEPRQCCFMNKEPRRSAVPSATGRKMEGSVAGRESSRQTFLKRWFVVGAKETYRETEGGMVGQGTPVLSRRRSSWGKKPQCVDVPRLAAASAGHSPPGNIKVFYGEPNEKPGRADMTARDEPQKGLLQTLQLAFSCRIAAQLSLEVQCCQ